MYVFRKEKISGTGTSHRQRVQVSRQTKTETEGQAAGSGQAGQQGATDNRRGAGKAREKKREATN